MTQNYNHYFLNFGIWDWWACQCELSGIAEVLLLEFWAGQNFGSFGSDLNWAV